ncbi:hypothetical protein BDAP_000707 [Binucleata daphniae]
MNELKNTIFKFLKTHTIDAVSVNLTSTNIDTRILDDISDLSLLSLSHLFFKNYKTKCFDEYFEIVEYLQIVDNEYKNIKIATLESLRWERENKIKCNMFCKSFLAENIDFEDREWILCFLVYLYIFSLQEVVIYKSINIFKKDKEETKIKMKVYKIEPSNNRKNLLKRYNKPSMSLDDYANKVMESMERFEEANKDSQMITKEMEEKERKNEETLDIERKDEERKDKSHFGTGNRRNFS